MAVLVDDLLKNVLINANSSDRIVIITGYFSPDIIDKIAALGKPFEYYYGMYGVDKIRLSVLSALRNINAQYSNLKISFVNTQRVHTKCYLFYDSNNMFNAINDYYKKIKKNSIDINDPSVKVAKNKKVKTIKSPRGFLPLTSDPLTAIMPLYYFDKKGKRCTYIGGGPNWGNQNGHTGKKRKAMEAYIPVLTDHLDYYLLLFQPKV